MAAAFFVLLLIPALAMAAPPPFSHRGHAAAGVVCAACHAGRGARLGTLSANGCAACHAKLPRRTAAMDALARLARSGRPVRWERAAELPSWVWFSHARHRKAACAECHGAVEKVDRFEQEIPLHMQFCRECHERTRARNVCGTCHADKGQR